MQILDKDFMTVIASFIKAIFIITYCCELVLKISNQPRSLKLKQIIVNLIVSVLISLIYALYSEETNYIYRLVFIYVSALILTTINIKAKLTYKIFVTGISLSINYVLFYISVMLCYIPKNIFHLDNIIIEVIMTVMLYTLLLYAIIHIRKFKKGLNFLNNEISKEYFELIIANICVIILFSVILIANYYTIISVDKIGVVLIILTILMFITIYKSFDLYYKQKQLIATLEKTKEELENKTKEVERLEEENLNFSKTSHSLAHKQRILEHKINQLMQSGSSADKSKVKEEFDKISNELYKSPEDVELTKTGIDEIDSVLEYMQSECTKNKIDFQVQISGNIYYMVNNIISREKLEILLADHIKNAIIAIQYSDNVNKSILVRIGNIEDVYSVYIYDSGIEFEKETLENLGKKPSTTHADNGGTGMGFMNTFDTLKEYKASLIINEFNAPIKDNFTKSIVIKFDGKENFEIKSFKIY